MINILGINLHNFPKSGIKRKIDEFLAGNKPRQIVTVNPEFIITAQRDEEFFYILNKADLSTADGVGLVFAGLCLFRFVHRVTGVWLCRELLNNKKIKKILIINWNKGLQSAGELKKKLEKKFSHSSFLILDYKRQVLDLDWEQINNFQPQLVLSTLGSPWQEKILFLNKDKFKDAKILVGVGAAIDYLTGKLKRAPKIFRLLGLEWLYRVIIQPERIKRIYNATVKFTGLFLKWRIILPFKYRRNVACILYKKTKNNYQFFMVERADQAGHWQIPQGGLGKLSIKEAGMKELTEEAGAKNIKYITNTGFIYKYKFPFNMSRHRGAIYHRFTGYKGQKQALLIAEYTGDDNDIKISHWDHLEWKWVDIDKVLDKAHEVRKDSMKKYLEIFNKYYEIKN